ncbi:MAG: hypothetical protein R6V27_05380 [Balneolaceae bacterium]
MIYNVLYDNPEAETLHNLIRDTNPCPPGQRRPDAESNQQPAAEEEQGVKENDDREDSEMRDAELISIAKGEKELGNVLVIVASDFNDVPGRKPRTFLSK